MWRYGFQSRRIAENLGNREMGSWLFWLAPCRYLVHTYDGEIDYYNLRPPLSMWQIVLSCRLFGYNFIGLRFFSALYLVIITAVSMLFVKKAVGTLAASSLFCCQYLPVLRHHQKPQIPGGRRPDTLFGLSGQSHTHGLPGSRCRASLSAAAQVAALYNPRGTCLPDCARTYPDIDMDGLEILAGWHGVFCQDD